MSNIVSVFTQNMMQKFPSWMKLSKDEESIGAQFLDVFGVSLEEFREELDSIVNDFYIGTANVEMIDILYKVPLATENIPNLDTFLEVSIIDTNDIRREVSVSRTLREFYTYSELTSPKAYLDKTNNNLYLKVNFDDISDRQNPFRAISVNGTLQYEVIIHHVWNAFDELGLILGLNRLYGERNEEYKKRILDVFIHPSGNTKEGIKNGLSRELGLTPEEITINYLNDSAFLNTLVKEDGSPDTKLLSYAKKVNETLRFTYDEMNFNEAYWFSMENENLGIYFLPHIWDIDTDLLPSNLFQSGVGSGEDLKVFAPKEQSSNRNFKAYVGLMGYYEEVKELYPEISFKYKIYAKGKIPNKKYNEELFKYTIKASEEFKQPYSLQAKQIFDYDFRIDFFNPNDLTKTNDIRIIKSNDFLNTATDKILKLSTRLSTSSETESPHLPEYKIIWEDTDGEENEYKINKRDQFLNSQTSTSGAILSDVKYADIRVENDSLELGVGAFQQEYDSTADFQSGFYETNSIIIKDGKVSLNMDTLGKIRN